MFLACVCAFLRGCVCDAFADNSKQLRVRVRNREGVGELFFGTALVSTRCYMYQSQDDAVNPGLVLDLVRNSGQLVLFIEYLKFIRTK